MGILYILFLREPFLIHGGGECGGEGGMEGEGGGGISLSSVSNSIRELQYTRNRKPQLVFN
jgi:hypothetical protein